MLQSVDIGERRLDSYADIVGAEMLQQVREVADPLQGARVLHLNATPYGGGVSELLRSIVPLMNDLGIVTDWQTVTGDIAFFDITKRMHNALQGDPRPLGNAERASYLRTSELNARSLEGRFDFAIVHDPQPAALALLDPEIAERWIWRCHIDTSAPNPEVWSFLRPFLEPFDAAVFTMDEFVPPDMPVARIETIPPAIDPASPKNLPLDESLARHVLEWIGVRTDRPLVTQVSRFDPWKDPLGVIEAYRIARSAVPDLQLALVGSMAQDDPEAWEIYAGIRAASERDPRIHVFTNLQGVGNIEVNAFQRLSTVVVQKSIREGFGLVVSEAMWKATPVVAGNVGGIPLQMADGVGGRLVDDTQACGQAIAELATDLTLAAQLGNAGQQRVREAFLLPRLLLNELTLLASLGTPTAGSAKYGVERDPVCGMALPSITRSAEHRHQWRGRTWHFCSEGCNTRFQLDPVRWAPTTVSPMHP